MAAQNLVAQHLMFITTNYQFDTDVTKHALITQIANNSQNKRYYMNASATNQISGAAIAPLGSYVELIFIITPSYQTTFQANMPNLVSAFPMYQLDTWGENVSYGY